MKFNKHSHIPFLVLAISIVLFVSAIYVYMYREAIDSIQKSAEARAEVASVVTDKLIRDQFLADYKETSSDWDKLPNYFVDANNVVSFIEKIESIGRTTGSEISLSSIDADKIDPAATSTQGMIRANVVANGSWLSVIKTLKLMELLPFGVTIKDVKMSMNMIKDKDREMKTWTLSLQISAPLLNIPKNK